MFNYFDPEERRRTVFPEECRKAFDLGARMADAAKQAAFVPA